MANTSKTSSIKSPSITACPPHIFKPSYGPVKYREKAQMLSSFLKCCDVQKHYRVVSKTGAIKNRLCQVEKSMKGPKKSISMYVFSKSIEKLNI